MQIFSIASQRAQWLSAKLGVIAGNVANASTPGFHAREITPFSAVLKQQQVHMARTHPAHLNIAGGTTPVRFEVREAEPALSTHSGNTVELEKEMLEGAETVRAFRLNNGIVRAWHQMCLLALKDS